MFKDLQKNMQNVGTKNNDLRVDIHKDNEVACNIVGYIFRHVNICLKENRSKVPISLFARGFIKGITTDNVIGGINNFIQNMEDKDIGLLLNDIQKELMKRKR